MAKIRAHLLARRHIYIHNDLANSAFYFKNRIEDRSARDDQEGVGLEIMAGLIMLAFANEARVNFLGDRLISGWNERAPAMNKVELVFRRLGLEPDFDVRPYVSVKQLKEFRDTLAHGKPVILTRDEEIVATPEELDALVWPDTDWKPFVDKDFLLRAFSDLEEIWRQLLEKSGLELFDTLNHGDHHIDFIEHVKES